MNVIIKAAQFATKAHSGQYRKFSHTDEPYVMHPMRVAGRVTMLAESTEAMVVAAWLHDVVEDTSFTAEDLRKEFGEEVADLVSELTNTSKQYPGLSRAQRKQIDRYHIAKISNDAKMIKLVDRLDNLRDVVTDSKAPEDFVLTYCMESGKLLEVLVGVNEGLENELKRILEFYWFS